MILVVFSSQLRRRFSLSRANSCVYLTEENYTTAPNKLTTLNEHEKFMIFKGVYRQARFLDVELLVHKEHFPILYRISIFPEYLNSLL